MVLVDLQLTHLTGLNLGNGDPTKGMIQLNESHPYYSTYQTHLRQLSYVPVSTGWFIRDVYDLNGISTCETTAWAREAFSLGRCLTFHTSNTSSNEGFSYTLTCTTDALRVEYFYDTACSAHKSYIVKYYQFDCMNSCTANLNPPYPSGKWAVRSFFNSTHGCQGDAASFVAVKEDYCVYVIVNHQPNAHSFMLKYPDVYHYDKSTDCTPKTRKNFTTLNLQCAAIDCDPISRKNYDFFHHDYLYDDYVYIDQRNLTNMLPHGQWSQHKHIVVSLIGMRIGIAVGVIAALVCCVFGCIRWYRSRDKVRVYTDPTAEAAQKAAAEKAAADKRRFRGVRKNRGSSVGSRKLILEAESGVRSEKKRCCSCCC